MSITAKPLINAKYAASAGATEYTVPASTKTIIDKFTATNSDSGAVTITVNLIPSGGSLGNSNAIVLTRSIASGATSDLTELQNQVLAAGDAIYAIASVANKMTIRASGREVT